MRRLIAPIIVVLALAACGDRSPLGPSTNEYPERADSPALDVLTWNIYVGAPAQDLLLLEDPAQIPFEVAVMYDRIMQTNFPERADAIADQIVAANPHVVGLQEVTTIRRQSPGDFLIGNPVPATAVVQDWLGLLQQALVARGADYVVVAVATNFDVEVPMVNFATGGLDDARLTDYDVLMVRADVPWSNAHAGNYAAVLPISLGGVDFLKPSGWNRVDITLKGLSYRIINAHPEAADIAPGVLDPQLAALQAAQASELMAMADASPYPVVLIGDLNTAAGGTTTTMYQDLLAFGFVDAWTIGPPRGLGYSGTQDKDLRNPVSKLHHRIDYILYRDERTAAGMPFNGSVHIEQIGEEQADWTVTGMWPSDHAGLFGSLRIAPGLGH
jgi:endonuclease/exonuclease/phosphatase family metal-dependent hydrolase